MYVTILSDLISLYEMRQQLWSIIFFFFVLVIYVVNPITIIGYHVVVD